MSIELYVFPPSPRAFKVMAVANHLGLDCALRMVDFSKGEHRTPEYAALNPNMRMPTLKDDDFVIWESNAINQYLASQKPESGLLPKDEKARLDVTRWQFWDLAHWDPACAVFVFEYLVKPVLLGIKEQDAAALAKGTELFNRAAAVLEGQLKGRKIRHRRHPDTRRLRARRAADLRRHRPPPARALRRDQAVVRNARRAAGVAEDARAMYGAALGDGGLIPSRHSNGRPQCGASPTAVMHRPALRDLPKPDTIGVGPRGGNAYANSCGVEGLNQREGCHVSPKLDRHGGAGGRLVRCVRSRPCMG
jgi:glutathione S-transferase